MACCSCFIPALLFLPPPDGELDEGEIITMGELWKYAGRIVIQFNLFLPVVGGILAADRMQRDFRLGVRELQNSTPLSRPAYILGKYFGVLASLLLPVFLWVTAVAVALAATGYAPWAMLYAMPVACLAMTVPAFAFVTAFSLACPLIMPLRVYQILFTGYWFWGNFLNSESLPYHQRDTALCRWEVRYSMGSLAVFRPASPCYPNSPPWKRPST